MSQQDYLSIMFHVGVSRNLVGGFIMEKVFCCDHSRSFVQSKNALLSGRWRTVRMEISTGKNVQHDVLGAPRGL